MQSATNCACRTKSEWVIMMQGIPLVRHTLQLIIRTAAAAAAAAVGNCNCKVKLRQKRQKPAKVFTSSALFETQCRGVVCSVQCRRGNCCVGVVCVFGIKLAWPVGNTFHFVHANCHCSRQHPPSPTPLFCPRHCLSHSSALQGNKKII